uniref:N-acetyltransferase domain-containing protein n=2 Tax=Ditylum brightwellii TaxID=49249 RepID=A0A6U3U1B8_9STRA|mmetsp:Transcript_11500/g.17087  ORF Transcript_11500/g.17087 Transcript_11500/m.17087 type:complete len:263 (-) Transcript_11500:861-1649(-)
MMQISPLPTNRHMLMMSILLFTASTMNLITPCSALVGLGKPTMIMPPMMGLGSIFLKPKNTITPSLGVEDDLTEAGKFFTDAFWRGKVGGGAKTLSPAQATSLERQQIMEFRRRYGPKMSKADRRAELLLCRSSSGDFLGCAGIEVDLISKADGSQERFPAPLMSNLAVNRNFRRRGVAEDLVKAAEELARREWGYNECYLYVEKQNVPAVKLYRKLGYRPIWEDDSAKTLLPTESGKVKNVSTTIVCMKKRVGGLRSIFPF